MTAADFLRDMTDFVHVNPASIRKAEKLDVNEENNAQFRQCVEDWDEGRYDENQEQVVDEVEQILREASWEFEN